LIDPAEVKTIEVGAAVKIHATCLNNHVQKCTLGRPKGNVYNKYTVGLLYPILWAKHFSG
jgi:hypothetical protein